MATTPTFTHDSRPIHAEVCPHCQLPILPGESHGEIVPAGSVPLDSNNYGGILREPSIRCRILKLQQVEEVIEVPGRG